MRLPVPPRRRSRSHSLEALEARIAPATLVTYNAVSHLLNVQGDYVDDGSSNIQAGTAETLSLSVSGGNLVITDSTHHVTAASAGVTQVGTGQVSVPLASLTGDVTIELGTGTDTLTFNNALTLATDRSLSAHAQGNITISNAQVAATGTGGLSLTTGTSLLFTAGSSLSVVNGNLDLSANATAAPSSATYGIDLNGASLNSTGTGHLSLIGAGALGIELRGGAVLNSSGTGTVALNGTALGSFLKHGVELTGSATKITSATGDITVQGHGGAGQNVNMGIFLHTGAVVSSTGAAKITLTGTGGSGTEYNYGVGMEDLGTRVTSVDGDVVITGTGGVGTLGSNVGIFVQRGAVITSTGAARLDLVGTGGSGTDSNAGIDFSDGGQNSSGLSSVNGDITLTGTSTDASGANQDGVRFESTSAALNSFITTTGTALLSITGTAGNASGFGIDLTGTTVFTLAGAVDSLIANSINLNSSATINAGNHTVSLMPKSSGVTVGLGVADGPSLGLTDAELDIITAGAVLIGNDDVDSNEITFSAVISPLNYQTLSLEKDAIFFSAGGFAADLTSTAVYEHLVVMGTLTIDPAATLDVSAVAGFVPVTGDSFTIIDNQSTGATTGQFAGKPEGGNVPLAGTNQPLTYHGGTGNDVVLGVDPTISLALPGANSATEAAAGSLVYTFTRNGSASAPLTVAFNVGGSAQFSATTGAVSDYSQTGAATFSDTAGTVTFPTGANTVDVTLNVTNDASVEGAEFAILTLANGAGYVVSNTNSATGALVDNDTATVGFAQPTSSVSEGAGTSSLSFLLTIHAQGIGTPRLERAVSLSPAATGGTATQGGDFSLSGGASFNVGALDGAIATAGLNVIEDGNNEGAETADFSFSVTDGTNGQVSVTPGGSSHTLTIVDNESGLTAALAGGVLTISDGDSVGISNALTIVRLGSDLVITEGSELFGVVPAGAALSNGGHTLTIPFANVASGLVVQGGGGDDTLTVDLSGGNALPAGSLLFSGGSQGATGDKLIITGGSQGTVTYNYTNAHDGSIGMTAIGTISYTGLEPIVNSGGASDIIFNLSATANIATLGDDGAAGNALTRLSGANFEQTDFAQPSGTVTINPGTATDTLTVNALPDYHSGLVLGTAAQPFATLTFAGAVALADNQSLSAHASEDIKLSSAGSDLSTTGAGSLTLMSDRNLLLADGASMSTVTGGITLDANQQTPHAAGGFEGVTFGGASLTSASGDIIVRGQGGTVGGRGISFSGGAAMIVTAGAGAITLEGHGTGTNGLFFGDAAHLLQTENGHLSLTGTSTDSVTAGAEGISFLSTIANQIAVRSLGSGDVTLQASTAGNPIDLNISGVSLSAGSGGDLALLADHLTIFPSATISGTGSLVIKPVTPATSIGLGTGAGTLQLDASELATIRNGFSSITIGDAANDAAITVKGALVRADPVTFTLASGQGAIDLTGGSLSAALGTINLRAGGQIFANSGGLQLVADTLSLVAGAVGGDGIGAAGKPLHFLAKTLSSSTAGGANQWLFAAGSVDLLSLASGSKTINFEGGDFTLPAGALTDASTVAIHGGHLLLEAANALQNSTVTVDTLNGVRFGDNIGTATFGGLAGSGDLALTHGANLPLTLRVGNNNADTVYSGDLSGPGTLVKIGTGTLTLSGLNKQAGGTTLAGGTLQIASDASFGLANVPLTLQGGTLRAVRSANITRPVVLESGSNLFEAAPRVTLTISGLVSGPGGLFYGAGRVEVTNPGNTNSGPTELDSNHSQVVNGVTISTPGTAGEVIVTPGLTPNSIASVDLTGTNTATSLIITGPPNTPIVVEKIISTDLTPITAIVLGRNVTLGDGVADSIPDLVIAGKLGRLAISDVQANTIMQLGKGLSYLDTYKNKPNVTMRNILGDGVVIDVTGDGVTAGGTGGGGLGAITVNQWSGASVIKTTQSIKSLLVKKGNFNGLIQVDPNHLGVNTVANMSVVSIPDGMWVGTGMQVEGVVAKFLTKGLAVGSTISAGAFGAINIKGNYAGSVVATYDANVNVPVPHKPPKIIATGGIASVTISGTASDFTGVINGDGKVGNIMLTGSARFMGTLRGGSIGNITAASFTGTPGTDSVRKTITAIGSIGNITAKEGGLTNYLIAAGTDLGSDAKFGGVADHFTSFFTSTTGVKTAVSIGAVTIKKTVIGTTIAAGVNPGAAGIYGDADDAVPALPTGVTTKTKIGAMKFDASGAGAQAIAGDAGGQIVRNAFEAQVMTSLQFFTGKTALTLLKDFTDPHYINTDIASTIVRLRP